MNSDPSSVLLTRAQIAAVLGVSLITVSRLEKAGRIPCVSIGRRQKRYDREAVVAALSQPLKNKTSNPNSLTR